MTEESRLRGPPKPGQNQNAAATTRTQNQRHRLRICYAPLGQINSLTVPKANQRHTPVGETFQLNSLTIARTRGISVHGAAQSTSRAPSLQAAYRRRACHGRRTGCLPELRRASAAGGRFAITSLNATLKDRSFTAQLGAAPFQKWIDQSFSRDRKTMNTPAVYCALHPACRYLLPPNPASLTSTGCADSRAS